MDGSDFTVRQNGAGEWLVFLPHQSDAWDIAGNEGYGDGVSHAEAVAALEKHIADAQVALRELRSAEPRARVTLFKPGGKYYTCEEWRIPADAIGPHDMARSEDFRRGWVVLVEEQEPWGYPHLFPAGTE
jgi:hypothetical protein